MSTGGAQKFFHPISPSPQADVTLYVSFCDYFIHLFIVIIKAHI